MTKIPWAIVLVGFIALATIFVSARLGFLRVSATATPSSWETSIATASLHASLRRQSDGLVNPLPASEEVLLAGLKIFKMDCAGCHGMRGEPSAWGTQNFYPRVPQFAQQPPRLSAPQIFVAVKNGLRYSGMGAWKGMLSEEEIWKVATFLEHIDSLPATVEAGWKQRQ